MYALLLLLPLSQAADRLDLSAAWRPTLRRAYVFYGDSTDQIPLGALVAGAMPDGATGLANSDPALGRFEASARYRIGDGLAVQAGVLGGGFDLQFASDQPVHQGSDWNFDIGGSITRKFSEDLRFQTVIAGRVRVWALSDVPVHGNVGVVLGVKPAWKGLSLYVESTLAAVWLTGLTDWGAQKDSSILRIRPEYAWHVGDGRLTLGLDYYHTHTEFFGTKLIEGQDAFMLDDFDLALVVGGGWSFGTGAVPAIDR